MPEILDAEWYPEYKALKPDTPIYEQLRNLPSSNAQKSRFASDGFRGNPELKPEVDLENVRETEEALWRFRDRLYESDAPEVVKAAYMPRLKGKLLGMSLLRAVCNKDAESFVRVNMALYGEPDMLIFSALNSYFWRLASDARHEPANIYVQAAAQQLLDTLPGGVAITDFGPAASEFKDVQQLFTGFFDDMFKGIELTEDVSGPAATTVVERVLHNLQYDYTVIDQAEGVSTMAVNQKHKQVKLPPQEIYTPTRFKGLLGHEVIHIMESENGEKQPLQLLADGLRLAAFAGEGKGVVVEQVAYPNWQDFMATRRAFDIARRHYSISLARGLDGNGERDFQEVFRIMYAIDRLWELTHSSDDVERSANVAVDRTWELLTKRTLKGVVGKGAAYFKDKVYAEGNDQQWGLLIAHPEAAPYLNLGHYDLTNPDHVRILKEIGTIPTQLSLS